MYRKCSYEAQSSGHARTCTDTHATAVLRYTVVFTPSYTKHTHTHQNEQNVFLRSKVVGVQLKRPVYVLS